MPYKIDHYPLTPINKPTVKLWIIVHKRVKCNTTNLHFNNLLNIDYLI
jgi:hypothetical protein